MNTAAYPQPDSYIVYWKLGDHATAEDVLANHNGYHAGLSIDTAPGLLDTITGLTGGQIYTVAVEAVKAGYSNARSAALTATPTTATSSFSTHPAITVTPGPQKLDVRLSTAAAPPPDSYTVYWKLGNHSDEAYVRDNADDRQLSLPGSTTAGAILYTINGLTGGQVYTVVVEAEKADYSDALSAPQTGTPVLGIFSTAPTISVTAGNTSLAVTLTNTPDPTPTNYDVYWLAGAGKTITELMAGTTKALNVSGGLPYTINSLSNGATYSVAAVAKKAGYNDGVSNVVSGTPTIGVVASYTATADGSAGVATTKIDFVFSATVTGLDVADITIGGTPGAADKGALTGSGTDWSLTLSNVALGAAEVSISKGGIESGVKPITLWDITYGDTGPGGGLIFYVSLTGFGPGNAWHYLEAAQADVPQAGYHRAWATHPSKSSTFIAGAAQNGIGTGAANTAAILAEDSTAPAALACADYTGGGKTDWFLPSRDELNQIYLNLMAPGKSTFRNESYWSSSQHPQGATDAYCQSFRTGVGANPGNQSNNMKYVTYPVRPARGY
jgi:hypothetical protein